MTNSPSGTPVMLPFQDQGGPGWHVIIRYRHGPERRVDGFTTEDEAMQWIVANAGQVDQDDGAQTDPATNAPPEEFK